MTFKFCSDLVDAEILLAVTSLQSYSATRGVLSLTQTVFTAFYSCATLTLLINIVTALET